MIKVLIICWNAKFYHGFFNSSSPPDFFLHIALYVKKTWLIYIIKLKDWCLLEGKLKTTSMHFSRSKGFISETLSLSLRRKWKCWIFFNFNKGFFYKNIILLCTALIFHAILYGDERLQQNWVEYIVTKKRVGVLRDLRLVQRILLL